MKSTYYYLEIKYIDKVTKVLLQIQDVFIRTPYFWLVTRNVHKYLTNYIHNYRFKPYYYQFLLQ